MFCRGTSGTGTTDIFTGGSLGGGALFLDGSLRSSEAGDGNSERTATDVAQAHLVAELHGLLAIVERMVVVLRRHESMPYEEIAAVLGTTVPSVKSLLFRARNTLREKLAPYLEG